MMHVLWLGVAITAGASAGPGSSRVIAFPNLPGYLTLPCDLHEHTVFSDGQVWPDVRVEEALHEGLAAIAITDHVEYQPHAADLPNPDRNRSYELARKAAGNRPLLVIRGAEITRDFPPGHANAVFLRDVNALKTADPIDAYREAARQGAFVFWDHPSWLRQTPDGVARLTSMHEQLLAEKLIQGIEVANDRAYSDEALQIALDHNLTILANSDLHGLADWTYQSAEGEHRPVTLVFAKARTADAIKEALLAGRTIAWFNNTLIGRTDWMDRLLAASLVAKSEGYGEKDAVLRIRVANSSDADFMLRNISSYNLHQSADIVVVKAHSHETLMVKTVNRIPHVDVPFQVLNAVIAPGAHAKITFSVDTGAK